MNLNTYLAHANKMSASAAYLETLFPGKAVLPILTVGDILGMPQQTLRNKMMLGRFPIPTFKQGSRRMCLKTEVVAYLDRIAAAQDEQKDAFRIYVDRICHARTDAHQYKNKRGARTKAERIRAAANDAGGDHGHE